MRRGGVRESRESESWRYFMCSSAAFWVLGVSAYDDARIGSETS